MEKVFTVVMCSIGIIVTAIVLAGFVGMLVAFPLKWTWNATMPYLFGIKVISWGQAWCLYFLASCLIRSSQTNNNKGDK